MHNRFAAYGATKRAISHFNQSLGAELKMQGIGNVGIHDLQPGMCATDLLMSGADDADGKFFINCLGRSNTTTRITLIFIPLQCALCWTRHCWKACCQCLVSVVSV